MKDEKKAKPKKTDAKKDNTETNKSGSKKTAPVASGADSESKSEQVQATSSPVYSLTKNTSEITEHDGGTALSELASEFSQTQLDQMMSGELVLPFGEHIFSTDKAKLENIIESKGWNKPEQTVEYDEPQAAEPLHPDEFGGEDFSSEVPKDTTAKTDESLDVSDPNEPIYNLFKTDKAFAGRLNKKQTDLIGKMIDGKKVEASFSDTDKALWSKLKTSYGAYLVETKKTEEIKTGEDGQEDLSEFRTPEALARDAEEKKALEPDEVIPPLSDEEKTEYKKLNKEFKNAKTNFDNAPFEMMRIASEVRAKKLFRDDYGSMKEWAEKEHGITPKYALNLAQFGDFRNVLAEIGDAPLQMAGSVNSTEQWAQDTNKIAAQIGVKPSEFDVMKPIIEAVSNVVAEVATDGNGKFNSVAPRVFSAANDKIPEIIKTGLVEVNGEQMNIADVLALGENVVTESIQTQIVETVAEGIKAEKQNLVDYIKESKTRRTAAHEPAPKPNTNGKNVFTGVVPSYTVECTGHPEFDDNYIVAVFNAGFALKCGCKFQKLTTSGDSFVCIETGGKVVQHD